MPNVFKAGNSPASPLDNPALEPLLLHKDSDRKTIVNASLDGRTAGSKVNETGDRHQAVVQ
jgi:hypothetical protein